MEDQDGVRVTKQSDNTFAVMRGDTVLAAGLASNTAAWAWIDRHSDEGQEDTEREQRIGAAFHRL